MKINLSLLTLLCLILLNENSSFGKIIVNLPRLPELTDTTVFPLKGWSDRYSEFIKDRMDSYPELLNMPGSHVGKLCLNWDSINQEGRKQFWVNLIKSMSYGESGWNRAQMSMETAKNLRIDGLTKKAVFSEGLLQISYGSISLYSKIYQSESCNILYDGLEKLLFLADVKNYKNKGIRASLNADQRSLLNPIRNIACSLDIMYLGYLKKRDLHASSPLRQGIARYWSTLRPGRSGFKSFAAQFKKENKIAEYPCDFKY